MEVPDRADHPAPEQLLDEQQVLRAERAGQVGDPILGNSALDRLANASYQIVIDGESYRQRLSPHRALLEQKEVVDAPTAH